MELLYQALADIPEYRTLLDCAKQGNSVCLSGLGSPNRALVIAALRRTLCRPVCVVCADDAAAARMADDLACFLDSRPPVLPSRELSLAEASGVSREWEQKRLALLWNISQGRTPVFVSGAEALALHTMPKQILRQAGFLLRMGGAYERDALLARLEAAGYTRCDLVEGPGQYALRGGILDLYSPAESAPVRAEFFGDEVDALGWFDIQTQRRTENTAEALILPVAETQVQLHPQGRAGLIRDLEKLLARLKRRKVPYQPLLDTLCEDIDLLRGEARFLAADRYMSLIYPQEETAADYLTEKTIVVYCEHGAAERQLKIRQDTLGLELDSAAQAGRVAGELCAFLAPWQELTEKLAGRLTIYLPTFLSAAFPQPQPQRLLTITAKSLPSYGGSLDAAVQDLRHYSSLGYRCVVCCASEHRATVLHESLAQRGLPSLLDLSPSELPQPGSILVCRMALTGGTEFPEVGLAVLSDGQLQAGRKKQPRRKTAAAKDRLSAFTDLSPGDLVVHVTYGIGRYVGMEQLKLDGVIKDYVRIAYAGSDTLFLPATSLDQVSKYIGGGEGTTPLNRLGGSAWARTKAKTRAAVKELAIDLVQLYAQRARLPGYAFAPDTPWQREFEDSFAYQETDDQLRCTQEIKNDMEKPVPMDRLLCGDVGYGKTEVALRAAMKAMLDSKQVAILVPTTVLAQQHYATAMSRFRDFPVSIDVLSRFRSAAQQKKTLHAIETGTVDLVIGTHKLLQKSVRFKNLGLLIVDEEQRFGVADKEKLKAMSRGVDVLTLSATPIPRTLNMALSGIRDMSTLDEPPQDRYPVQTYVLEYAADVIDDAILRELNRGGQVYYLHNRIDSIESAAYKLRQRLGDQVSIGIAHGQMDENTLSDVMQQMTDGELQVLVCTTIIEAGVDIPNVNTLIVEDADRLGLAQLHQLRGRVGRSGRHAFAYLTYRKGRVLNEDAEKRLLAISQFAEFGSGIKIAMRDLEIRGAGSLLGAEQSGHMMSVGYDLYLKLLQEAVLEAQGQTPQPEIACTVDLTVAANIPKDYVSSGEQRMDLYRRMAAIRTEAQADDLCDELEDRFGTLPDSVMNLISVALLQGRASACGIGEISQTENKLRFSLAQVNLAAASGVCSEPGYKGRLVLEMGEKPALVLRLRSGEKPLRQANLLVEGYARFAAENVEM